MIACSNSPATPPNPHTQILQPFLLVPRHRISSYHTPVAHLRRTILHLPSRLKKPPPSNLLVQNSFLVNVVLAYLEYCVTCDGKEDEGEQEEALGPVEGLGRVIVGDVGGSRGRHFEILVYAMEESWRRKDAAEDDGV